MYETTKQVTSYNLCKNIARRRSKHIGDWGNGTSPANLGFVLDSEVNLGLSKTPIIDSNFTIPSESLVVIQSGSKHAIVCYVGICQDSVLYPTFG